MVERINPSKNTTVSSNTGAKQGKDSLLQKSRAVAAIASTLQSKTADVKSLMAEKIDTELKGKVGELAEKVNSCINEKSN